MYGIHCFNHHLNISNNNGEKVMKKLPHGCTMFLNPFNQAFNILIVYTLETPTN